MRILVIDDMQAQLEAARQTLKGHELTLVDNYDEAIARISKKDGGSQALDGLRAKTGLGYEYGSAEYDSFWKECESFPYEAVLCDLLMPAGKAMMASPEAWDNLVLPVGLSLSLAAALRGAKYVAVVTMTNHHMHPASAMLDALGSSYWPGSNNGEVDLSRPKFSINGATVGFYHAPRIQIDGQDVKNWGLVLRSLVADWKDNRTEQPDVS